ALNRCRAAVREREAFAMPRPDIAPPPAAPSRRAAKCPCSTHSQKPAKASKQNHSGGALLLANIGQLLTLRSPGKSTGPRRGHELNDVGIIEDAAVLCEGGKILAAGKGRDVLRHPAREKLKSAVEIDCRQKVVLPGFVDSHT